MDFELGREFLTNLRKNPENLWNLASKSSDEQIESCLDLLLFSFLVNEREFIDSVNEDNEQFMSDKQLKFKYKHFNPETIMGTVFKKNKQKNTITVENSKTDYFKIGSTDPKNLTHAKETLRLSKKQRFSVHKGNEVTNHETLLECKYKDLTVISGTKDSTYLCDNDGNIYFKGLFPHMVDKSPAELANMTEEEIENIMSTRPLAKPVVLPMDEQIEFPPFPTFHNTFAAICDSISHNNIVSRGDFYIFTPRKHQQDKSIIVSKEWVKAVCETIISAKSDFDKNSAEEFLNGEFGSTKSISRKDLSETLTKLLGEQISDSIFLENFVNHVSSKYPKQVRLSSDFTKKLVEYIALYDSQFKEETSLHSPRIPSKLYLTLIDLIAENRRDCPEKIKKLKELTTAFNEDYADTIADINDANKKLFNRFQKTRKNNEISSSLLSVLNRWQAKIFESTAPFYAGFMNLPQHLDLDKDLMDETKLLTSITQSMYPLNEFMMKFYRQESNFFKGYIKKEGSDPELALRMIPYSVIRDHFKNGSVSLRISHPKNELKFSGAENIKSSKILKCIKVARTAICHNRTYLSFAPNQSLILVFNEGKDASYAQNESNPTLSTTLLVDANSFNDAVDKRFINLFSDNYELMESKGFSVNTHYPPKHTSYKVEKDGEDSEQNNLDNKPKINKNDQK